MENDKRKNYTAFKTLTQNLLAYPLIPLLLEFDFESKI